MQSVWPCEQRAERLPALWVPSIPVGLAFCPCDGRMPGMSDSVTTTAYIDSVTSSRLPEAPVVYKFYDDSGVSQELGAAGISISDAAPASYIARHLGDYMLRCTDLFLRDSQVLRKNMLLVRQLMCRFLEPHGERAAEFWGFPACWTTQAMYRRNHHAEVSTQSLGSRLHNVNKSPLLCLPFGHSSDSDCVTIDLRDIIWAPTLNGAPSEFCRRLEHRKTSLIDIDGASIGYRSIVFPIDYPDEYAASPLRYPASLANRCRPLLQLPNGRVSVLEPRSGVAKCIDDLGIIDVVLLKAMRVFAIGPNWGLGIRELTCSLDRCSGEIVQIVCVHDIEEYTGLLDLANIGRGSMLQNGFRTGKYVPT